MSKHHHKPNQKPSSQKKAKPHKTGICNGGIPYEPTPVDPPLGIEIGPAVEGAEEEIRKIMKQYGLL